ncbi:Beta-catenin-like protein [Intoshia linei]|uniref:Beta-catenin-like protein n=1 Tax=Intoshia linei TaxID=1819745 RepID=A0A177B951_9BILA|nr:Beta-catenin-like protein [Intoshia linei]
MAKKTKKTTDKSTADVFDPVTLESSQSATVVLLLNSKEEEVVIKALESLVRYADKCDENRKDLFDLSSLDILIKLTQHENRTIRRNSSMCLAILTKNADVRLYLKRQNGVLSHFINLLGPDESSIIHEYAALSLSNICTDMHAAIDVAQSDALDALTKLLESSDPDVSKNAVETLSILAQNYQCRQLLSNIEIFPSLLNLLKSDYATIQQLSLKTLQLASLNKENRKIMQEFDAVNKLTDFLTHTEWSDLHPNVIFVMENLLEDVEVVEFLVDDMRYKQTLRNNGALRKIAKMLIDVNVEEDETTKKKPTKKDGKSGKKKGQQDADKQNNTESQAEAAIKLSIEIKESLCNIIAKSSSNVDNIKIFHEFEIDKTLLNMLNSDNWNIIHPSCQTLGVMATSSICRESIFKYDGLEVIIKLLKNDHSQVRQSATLCLANLIFENTTNANELNKSSIIDSINSILQESRDNSVINASILLRNMASASATIKSDCIKAGCVKAMLESIKTNANGIIMLTELMKTLSCYLTDCDARKIFDDCNGSSILENCLNLNDINLIRYTSQALTVACNNESIVEKLVSSGVLSKLISIYKSKSRTNIHTKLAIDRIFNFNLTVKFAYLDKLEETDIVTGLFVDVGRVRSLNDKVKTLNELAEEEVNHKKPIILINPDNELCTDNYFEVHEFYLEITINCLLRLNKILNMNEEEAMKFISDNKKEVELMDISSFDLRLTSYIEHVMRNIQPLPTLLDQVEALAMFVSKSMGGFVQSLSIKDCKYQLNLSELRNSLNTNVIPIGLIFKGLQDYRAVLFKILADRLGISCTLERGKYNNYWNTLTVILPEGQKTSSQRRKKMFTKDCIVDLVFHVGRLMDVTTTEAIKYKSF